MHDEDPALTRPDGGDQPVERSTLGPPPDEQPAAVVLLLPHTLPPGCEQAQRDDTSVLTTRRAAAYDLRHGFKREGLNAAGQAPQTAG
ncbi:hypothetical protein Ade02nite_61110 [Paractinoplanes deccanensis]|uniref:Uncharacterized protein n=1 Tax=Paractinoplanes deccanensis TaxID=113561 RepID=A0ABQ3YC15_9ACTN|nr:hypothetical protein Ade02nite_61110 [Actinoplanes deccanensis]